MKHVLAGKERQSMYGQKQARVPEQSVRQNMSGFMLLVQFVLGAEKVQDKKPIPIGINPVENLWHYLRSHYWANRIYVDYDALRLAAVAAWQKAALDKEIIKSVCFTKYAHRIDYAQLVLDA